MTFSIAFDDRGSFKVFHRGSVHLKHCGRVGYRNFKTYRSRRVSPLTDQSLLNICCASARDRAHKIHRSISMKSLTRSTCRLDRPVFPRAARKTCTAQRWCGRSGYISDTSSLKDKIPSETKAFGSYPMCRRSIRSFQYQRSFSPPSLSK